VSADRKGNTKLIEIIGPAGAGKSTLALLLAKNPDVSLVDQSPNTRRMADIPFFIIHILKLIPTLFYFYIHHKGRWLTKREIAEMAILTGWPDLIKRQAHRNGRITLLDEGPIFIMAFLMVYGPDLIRCEMARKWWRKIYKEWAKSLDEVIWLDASNTNLVARIRSREKPHGVKIKSDQESFQYFDAFRKTYKEILHSLIAFAPEISVRQFDTSQVSMSQITRRIAAELSITRSN